MSKIPRFAGNLLAFAINATGTERTVFGDVVQSDTLDANINADFLRGWGIVGVNENPTKQDFNAVAFSLSQVLAYLHQIGVPEYHASQEYQTYGITNKAGVLYISQTDSNIGNDPAADDGTNWVPFLDNALAAATVTPASDADVTLTFAQYTKARLVLADGSWTSGHNIIVPNEERVFYVDNSGGTYDAVIKTAAGTGVTVAAGTARIVACDGTNVVVTDTRTFADSFTSTGQTITAAGTLTLAHGLGVIPELIQLRIKCTTADNEYAVGDEVIINPAGNDPGAAANRGVGVWADATNVYIRYGSDANTISIIRKTTGAANPITNGSWQLYVKAWS